MSTPLPARYFCELVDLPSNRITSSYIERSLKSRKGETLRSLKIIQKLCYFFGEFDQSVIFTSHVSEMLDDPTNCWWFVLMPRLKNEV